MKKSSFIVLVILIFLAITVRAKVIGNFNSSGGGGPKGRGTSQNYSIAGDFGIRFSLVDKKTGQQIGHSVDYFKLDNKQKKGKILHSLKGETKINYKKFGAELKGKKARYLADQGGYAYYKSNLWNVVDYAGRKRAGREFIMKWVQSKHSVQLAQRMKVSLAEFKSPDNRVVIEPIFYFTLGGEYYGLTAHEIALVDSATGGKIRAKHVSRSHQNFPLALYLKKGRFTISKHNGQVKRFSNAEIVERLGIGIIGAKDKLMEEPPKLTTYDYIYRCDTDVYTSVELTAQSDSTPDNPLDVTFYIPSVGNYEVNYVYAPAGYSQLVWVKWHTPNTPMELEILVRSNKGVGKTLKADIRKKVPWEPQNPKADDKKPVNLTDFQINFNPNNSNTTKMKEVKKTSWSKWEIVEYQPRGDFLRWDSVDHYKWETGSDGKQHRVFDYTSYHDIWDEKPYWSFGKHDYTTSTAPDGSSVTYVVNGRTPTEPTYYQAEIGKATLNVKPAKTCKKQNPDPKFIKSGYGIEADLELEVKGNGRNDVTGFQSAKYFFPEFNYKKYWRFGERIDRMVTVGKITDKLKLPKNWYSYTGYHGYTDGRYHFLPIWYPDGNYKVHTNVYDCWTPAGELKVKAENKITCKGAMWDDWHIQIEK